jgi:hypothetical protein
MRFIKELLFNPIEAVKRTKVKRNIEKISSLLVVEWFIISIANIIMFGNLGKLTMISTGITVFLAGIPLTLFISLILFLIMRTLTGKGSYYKALTGITFGLFAISMGILISSPFVYVPKFGFLIMLLLLSITGSLSLAVFYRSIKELFDSDIVTTWIGMGLVGAGLMLAVYLTMLFLFGGTPNFQPVFSAMGALNL